MVQQQGHMLEMEQLTKIYGQGAAEVVAVDRVDLQVAQGEVLLIMGPSGSGKTTLLTMAGALLSPTSGQIRIGGETITHLPQSRLTLVRRQKVGFIFQSFNLLASLTALENVEVALNLAGIKGIAARSRALELLTEFGLEHRLHYRPEHLSGGEKQRVSIARALVNDPLLVLADEPTANLDSQRGHEIMQLLRLAAKERSKTVVIVSHDQRIRDIADRVAWLEDGKFKEVGEVIHDPVCGMALERFNAAALSTYRGQTYYFCAPGCKHIFDENPERYAAQ